jgi:hypothetical protein
MMRRSPELVAATTIKALRGASHPADMVARGSAGDERHRHCGPE